MNAMHRRLYPQIAIAILLTCCNSVFAFYNPHVGRWVSRDPIGEKGGPNQSAFCNNSPPSSFDSLGLLHIEVHDPVILPARPAEPEGGITWTIPHEANWVTVNCGSWGTKKKITGYALSADTYTTIYGDPDRMTSGTRTVRQHEAAHAANDAESLTDYDAFMSWFNGRCVCIPCFNALQNYRSMLVKYLNTRLSYKQAVIDCEDYPPGVINGINHKQERCNDKATLAPKVSTDYSAATAARTAANKACGM